LSIISEIKKVHVSVIRAELNQPFRTALGQHDFLENVLFRLELQDKTQGFGEAAIATHITTETVEQTVQNLQSIGQELIGQSVQDYLRISHELSERFPQNKAAVAAIEMSLLDALTKQLKIPLWQFFGNKIQKLKTDITIVIGDLHETQESVKKYYAQGFRAFKIKIGRDEDLDYKRVLAVKRLAPRSQVYLDANQGYSAEQTLRFLKLLKKAKISIDLLEQPVPKEDWEGLKKVTRLSGVRVCADESVQTVAQAVRAIREKVVNVINIKTMKCGLLEAREIAALAKASQIELMIGGMMETVLSMTASAHFAIGVGGFKYIDLDTPFFIKDQWGKSPYLSRTGIYDLTKVKAGIGRMVSPPLVGGD